MQIIYLMKLGNYTLVSIFKHFRGTEGFFVQPTSFFQPLLVLLVKKRSNLSKVKIKYLKEGSVRTCLYREKIGKR